MNKLQLGKLPKLLPKGIKTVKPIQLTLIVITVVLVALIGYFSFSYFQGTNTKDKLEKDKQHKEATIQTMPIKNISALKSEFDALNESYTKNCPFPASIDNVEVAYQIMQAAREAKISSTLTYAPQNTEEVFVWGNNSFLAQAYNVDATTSIKNMTNFLKSIECLHEEMHMQYDPFGISVIPLTNSSTLDTLTNKYMWHFSFTLRAFLPK